MEVTAKTRNLRMSARKVRLVADSIRGLDATTALARLHVIAKASRVPLEKLVLSALANAEHNFRLDKNLLFIKKIAVDEGMALKRWRARAYGRAAPIRKHSCHITIVLDERAGAAKKQAAKKTSGKKGKTMSATVDVAHDTPKAENSPTPKNMKADSEGHAPESLDPRRLGKHRNQQNTDRKELHAKKGFVKTFFNRKSGS